MTHADGDGGSRRIRRVLVLLAQLLLTGLVTWFIFRRLGIGLDELSAADPAAWTLDWWILGLASAVLLAGYLLSAALWGVMVRELGGPGVGLRAAVRVFLLANLGRYVPGKVWQIAGLAYLGRDLGVGPGLSTAAAVLGQVTALLGASAVGSAALLGAPAGGGAGVAAVLLVVAAAVLFLSLPPVFRRVVRFGYRRSAEGPPPTLLADRSFVPRWVALYALNWGVYAVAFWLFVEGVGMEAPPAVAASSFAAAYVLGYLAFFAPAGVGVREGLLAAFLGPSLGAAPAGMVAIAARVWTTAVEVVPAAVLGGRHLIRRTSRRRKAG